MLNEFLDTILTINYVKISIPFFLLAVVVEAWISWKKGRELYRLNDSISSLTCGIFQQFFLLFMKSFFLLAYGYIQTQHGVLNFSGISPGEKLVSALGLFLAVDCCYYWFHRMAHEINFGWATHIVHHSSEEYNLSTALRQGMLQETFSFVFYLPLALIGFPPLWFLALSSLNTTYQFWVHTRLLGRFHPYFEFVFNTPSHHRVHHGRNPKYLDKNYAGTLIIWDRLFGTFQKEEEEPIYGVTVPLNSWNPLRTQFHYFADLLADTWRAPYVFDKFKVWWARPGFRPRGLESVVKHICEKKFDPPISANEKRWAQNLFLMGLFLAILVLLLKDLSWTKSILVVLVVGLLTYVGKLLETKTPET
ncbi:MAG: sterol desaturase family protein [Deltaproteobacteria bacterium]|nr:sterol desaturase family protein [Deltaproteobacteria bacterium]